MGEWGKWWSGRGKDQVVKCTFCGRNVPKHKSVTVNTGGRLSRDVYEVAEIVSMGGSKGYACISCAKHRHLVKDGIHTTEKDKRMKLRAKEKREMDKVMQKVKLMEKTEKSMRSKEKPVESKPAPKPVESKPEAPAPVAEAAPVVKTEGSSA
jgi:ribosomal protein S26